MRANGKHRPDIGGEAIIRLTTDSFSPEFLLEVLSKEGPVDGQWLIENMLRPSRPFAPQAEVDALIRARGLEGEVRYDGNKGRFLKRRRRVIALQAN